MPRLFRLQCVDKCNLAIILQQLRKTEGSGRVYPRLGWTRSESVVVASLEHHSTCRRVQLCIGFIVGLLPCEAQTTRCGPHFLRMPLEPPKEISGTISSGTIHDMVAPGAQQFPEQPHSISEALCKAPTP
eukprot:2414757-Amphidinium_carterae.1